MRMFVWQIKAKDGSLCNLSDEFYVREDDALAIIGTQYRSRWSVQLVEKDIVWVVLEENADTYEPVSIHKTLSGAETYVKSVRDHRKYLDYEIHIWELKD